MSKAERFECSAVSASSDEPLTGTASRLRWWLMVEQPGAWGHNALVESAFPVDVGMELRRLGSQLGVRVLLIKRRDRLVGPRRCFFAYTGVDERRIRSLDVEDPAELLDLDLASMVARRFEGVGKAVEGPLFLVCTHGKHDQCCAKYGAPMYRAIADLENAWECTHIGGDRFAGNLVCFPHGVYYGRVPPNTAPRLAALYAEGLLMLELYRGRSAYSPPAQAAEVRIRWHAGLTGVDDLEPLSHRREGGGLHVLEFAGRDGRRYAAEVEVGRLDPRLLTCKAPLPHAPRSFTVRILESVED